MYQCIARRQKDNDYFDNDAAHLMIVPASQVQCFFIHNTFREFEKRTLTMDGVFMDEMIDALFEACASTMTVDESDDEENKQNWLSKWKWVELETPEYYYVLHPEQEVECGKRLKYSH